MQSKHIIRTHKIALLIASLFVVYIGAIVVITMKKTQVIVATPSPTIAVSAVLPSPDAGNLVNGQWSYMQGVLRDADNLRVHPHEQKKKLTNHV